MTKAGKYLFTAVFVTALSIIISIVAAFTIQDKMMVIRLTLGATLIATLTNLIIVALNYRSMYILINAEEEITDAEKLYKNFVQELDQAGLNAKKINKFTPLLDEVNNVVDNIETKKVGTAMEKIVGFINQMDLDSDIDIDKIELDEFEDNDSTESEDWTIKNKVRTDEEE